MEVYNLVVHEVIKKVNETGANNHLSQKYFCIDQEAVNFVESLEKSFIKKTLKRARLSTDSKFKAILENAGGYDLLKSSSDLTVELKNKILNVQAAKGGYLVFAEYENKHKFLAVFIVRNTKGTQLVRNQDGNFDIDITQLLDLEHFAMGVKINLSLLSNPDTRYVSLAKGNTEIAGYFEEWVGINALKEEKKDADALFEVSSQINYQDAGCNTRDELRKKIFDFAKAKPSKIVNIRDLSQFLFDDSDYIPNYCREKGIDIDGEFKLQGKNLDKFYKLFIKADGIELSATRASFNGNMIEVTKTGVIIRSQVFIDATNEHLKNKEDD